MGRTTFLPAPFFFTFCPASLMKLCRLCRRRPLPLVTDLLSKLHQTILNTWSLKMGFFDGGGNHCPSFVDYGDLTMTIPLFIVSGLFLLHWTGAGWVIINWPQPYTRQFEEGGGVWLWHGRRNIVTTTCCPWPMRQPWHTLHVACCGRQCGRWW